jgi:hypothetical protein
MTDLSRPSNTTPMAIHDDQPLQLRGALFGVNREDVADLQALLEKTTRIAADRIELAGRERGRADELTDRLADAQALSEAERQRADHAVECMEIEEAGMREVEYEFAQALMKLEFHERRLAEATHDSVVLAEGLDAAFVTLAGLPVHREDRDLEMFEDALHALLPKRIQSVSLMTADELPEVALALLRARESHAETWTEGVDAGPLGIPLAASAALAGEQAVLIRYAEDVYDMGGGFSAVVESLAHAVVSSIQARALAREHAAQRYPVSLLGDLTAARSFVALRVAQGETIVQVDVPLDFSTGEALTGVWGEPAWHATYFDLAVRLDKVARAVGGEAFESDHWFHAAVPAAKAEGVRAAAQEILDHLGLPGRVSSP